MTYDNTSEGGRVIQLARQGWTIIDAWFRTAWEIQPTTNNSNASNGPMIFVTAMYAYKGNHETRNDHLHGMGTTMVDSTTPRQKRYLMWSGTCLRNKAQGGFIVYNEASLEHVSTKYGFLQPVSNLYSPP